MFYVQGYGTGPDPAKGVALLRQADKAGDNLATTNLAVMEMQGDSARKSRANAGNADAENYYGYMLAAGRGTKQDYTAAANSDAKAAA